MSPTHVIRVDPNGRNTLPKEVRKALGVKNKTVNVAVVIEGDMVTLRQLPDLDKCIICGGEPQQEHRGKWFCTKCLTELPDPNN